MIQPQQQPAADQNASPPQPASAKVVQLRPPSRWHDPLQLIQSGKSVDVLFGGAGKDVLAGGAGNDVLNGDQTREDQTIEARVSVQQNGTPFGKTYYFPDFKKASSIIAWDVPVGVTPDSEGSDDILYGGAGDDRLHGGRGRDILAGESGNDVITGEEGDDYILDGEGNDALTGEFNGDTYGNGQQVQSHGNDYIDGGAGNDVIQGEDGSEQVTFRGWYANIDNRSVDNLQVVIEGSSDYHAGSTNELNSGKIVQFDFDGLVNGFDQARTATPSLTSWELSSSLLSFHLGSSDTAAIGGDLTYQYARNGNLLNLSMTAAQAVLADAQFGIANQNLQTAGTLQDLSPSLL